MRLDKRERIFIQIGDYTLHQADGLVLENNSSCYQITDFSRQYFGCAVNRGQVIIVYEEYDGSLMLVTEIPNGFKKEPLLMTKSKKFNNRKISLEVVQDEFYVFFSARYKQKNMILYCRNHQVRIFDFCDDKPFQTMLRNNGKIVVLYEKRGVVGYSILVLDGYSKFIPLNAKNPIKLFEWKNALYLLTQEDRYYLYELEQSKKHPLPLVYNRKPYLDWQEDSLYIRYRFLHKHVIYKLEDDEIIFVREEY